MPERFHAWLAWSLLALALLVLGLGLFIPSPKTALFVLFCLIAAPFAVVGALVASRRPDNPIGWLFVVFAVVAALNASADRYAYFTLVESPGSLPGGTW